MSEHYHTFILVRHLLMTISIDAKRLETVEAEIKATGGQVLSVAGDVGADDFPKKIVDATVQ